MAKQALAVKYRPKNLRTYVNNLQLLKFLKT